MDFEKNVPDWSATGTEPPESLKQSGFEAGYKPPAAYFNWFWNRVSACLAEIREKLKGHAEDKENPHGVTAAQVGLGNADNTADSEKHVAYAGTAGSANKVANQMIIRFNGGGTESTDKWTYDGSTSRSVNITPEKIGAAKDDLTNVENADLKSKVASAAVGVPIANAESSDGIAYTATVPGVTELINGMLLTIIPSMTSTSTNITLDVNGLGATNVRLPLSFNTAAMDRPRLDTFYVAERPITLQYDANYAAGGIWKVFEKNKTSAQDLYGTVPIESGGTNAKTAEAALENLGAAPKVHTHTVSDVDGAFAAADYDGLVTKTGNPVSQNMKAGRGITAVTTYSPKQAGSGEASPDNIRPISGWTGAKLTRCGKNLFDKSKASLNKFWSCVASNTSTNTYTGLFASDYIRVNSGVKYAITMYLSNSSAAIIKYWTGIGDTGGISGVRAGDAITCDGKKRTYTFTVPDGVNYITFTGDVASIDLIQLEVGSAATAYEPYHGNTYAAEIGQTVYGGTLNWPTGVLTVDFALSELDGSYDEKWSVYTYSSSGNKSFVTQSDVISGIVSTGDVRIPGICSYAQTQDGYLSGIQRSDVNNYRVEIKNDVIANWGITPGDLTAFKSMLAANPLQIAYKLATPTNIQLTPLMIESLAGENTVYSDGDSNVVTFNHDGALMYIMNRIAALEAASVNA